MSSLNFSALFEPFSLGSLHLSNRFVMAPMTRYHAPGGVPCPDKVAYYKRRAQNSVGLIITEGAWIPHGSAHNDENVPCFYGERALAIWREIAEAVHTAGSKIVPQLWHAGLVPKPRTPFTEAAPCRPQQRGPSGLSGDTTEQLRQFGPPLTEREIDEIIDAYATSAVSAYRLGFDGVELHGAHGYLIDQFLWDRTNIRTDKYGGSPKCRARFAADIVREIKRRTEKSFTIILRISQWKSHDYNAKLARTPNDLEGILSPLVDAGVDIFHCSQRRFWEAEFEGDGLNFAGWTRKLTGRPTITIGSVGLELETMDTLLANDSRSTTAHLDQLLEMYGRGEFDLVAVGRALIADPAWVEKLHRGQFSDWISYSPKLLKELY